GTETGSFFRLVMKKSLIKLFVLALIPLIPFMSVTNAQYHDSESSTGNYFAASSLDFSLRNQADDVQTSPLFSEQKLRLETKLEKSIRVVKESGMNFDYYPTFIYQSGNVYVCEALELTAERDGNEVYNGSLKDFDLASESASLTGNEDLWKFSLENSDDDIELQGETCGFDLKFSAEKLGFSD